MSYQLSVIDCNVALDIDIPKYDLDAAHLQVVVKLFQELEFRSLLNKLPKNGNDTTTPSRQVGTPLLSQEGNAPDYAKASSGEPQLSPENHGVSPPNIGGVPREAGGGGIGKQDYELIDTAAKLEKAPKNFIIRQRING